MAAEQVAAAVVAQASAGVPTSVTGVAAGLASLVGAATLLRRRLSRDRVELTKDRAEGTFVELLLRERDTAIAEAREATQARQDDAAAIARLTAQNESQARDLVRLGAELAALKRLIKRLHPEAGQYLDDQ
jgi:nitrate reductase gamma subunit